MRRKLTKKHTITPDAVYNSVKVSKFINQVMQSGNKSAARKIVYGALEEIKTREKVDDPVEVFEAALRNVSPSVEVRSRRVGGANYQVPHEVRPERRLALSMRWIAGAAGNKKGSPMHKKLADELIASSKGEGEAMKKKENMHKMAEANKAFAHLSW
jgi:small subunit ribosomal protein S7